MKRLFGALGALVFLAVSFAPAEAQGGTSRRWVDEPVKFRAHKATAAAGEFLTDGMGQVTTGVVMTACTTCEIDSFIARRVGAAGASAPWCTTAAVDMSRWPRMNNSAVADSMIPFCVFNVYDAGGVTQSGADSLWIHTQGSIDGRVWVPLGTPYGVVPTPPTLIDLIAQTSVAGGWVVDLSRTGAALARGEPIWTLPYINSTIASSRVANIGRLAQWRMVRWIIAFPDAAGYRVKASVSHQEDVAG